MQIGKNISGAGMDPNVIGFWRRGGGERKPDFRVLVALDLTAESHGNAIGIGLADVTTRNFIAKDRLGGHLQECSQLQAFYWGAHADGGGER